MIDNHKLIYVASPYSDPSASVRESRYLAVKRFVEHHIELGEYVISPIVYGHRLEVKGGFEFWKTFNIDLLNHCSAIWVLKLDGWLQSTGVQFEIGHARMTGIEVKYWDADSAGSANEEKI